MNAKHPCSIALILFVIASQMFPAPLSAQLRTRDIFPLQDLHVHSSSIVELPGGDLFCCWFEGSGERSANDVLVKGARLKKGDSQWSHPFILADTPGHPDCNPVLFIDQEKRLHLIWIVVQANRWETSILKWRVSTDYGKSEAPVWAWQDVILLKPGDEFAETIGNVFRDSARKGLAWAEYAPLYERMIHEAAGDPKKRETGWMTRTHPVQLPEGRILLPLYSDGFNLSLMAITDDGGKTWHPSLPIVGRGNVQPSVVRRQDGTLLAFMRDNGDEPGRIMTSRSDDHGYEWTAAASTDLPNPGASIEAIALRDGRWLLVYNDTEDGRHSLAVALSEDEGNTWKYTRHLEGKGNMKGSYSYPSMIQSDDGQVHITYSVNMERQKTIRHVTFHPDWVKN
jgi:predicted neuraminidase